MSILYVILIANFLGGIFRLGRLIDLLQLDILIAIVWVYNAKRWKRLQRLDKQEKV